MADGGRTRPRRQAGACPCCPDGALCWTIAPWTQMKLLYQPCPWCFSVVLRLHCLSLGCMNPVGVLGQPWTEARGCDWWRGEGAAVEGLSGRNDLSECRRSGAVHRDRCYGDQEDSWGEKEKRDFLNSWGTLHVNGGTRSRRHPSAPRPCTRGRKGKQPVPRGVGGVGEASPGYWPGRNP